MSQSVSHKIETRVNAESTGVILYSLPSSDDDEEEEEEEIAENEKEEPLEFPKEMAMRLQRKHSVNFIRIHLNPTQVV